MSYSIYRDKLGSSTLIVRLVDEAFIPLDQENIDYQQYLAWLADGNTPGEWSPDAD